MTGIRTNMFNRDSRVIKKIDFSIEEASIEAYGLETAVATGGSVARHSSDGGTGRLTLTNVQTAAAVMNGGAPSIEPEDTDAVVIEARVRVSDVDESSIFFGFTDADNDSVIIEDEDGSLNTVATDAFGFLLEGEQDETWQAVGVKNGADNAQTLLIKAPDPADNEWNYLRVEGWWNGLARFIINGQLVAEFKDYFRPGQEYTFAIGADGRGTAYTVDVQDICLEYTRPQNG